MQWGRALLLAEKPPRSPCSARTCRGTVAEVSDRPCGHVLFRHFAVWCWASAGSWAVQLTDHDLLALGNGLDGDEFQRERAM